MRDNTGKMIPPPPSMRPTHVQGVTYKAGLDRTGNQGEVSPWDFPTDLGIERPNYGAHGGLTAAGKADADKVRAIRRMAAQEGRLVR